MAKDNSGYRIQEPKNLPTDLDPHLQDTVLAFQAGEDHGPSVASRAADAPLSGFLAATVGQATATGARLRIGIEIEPR